jgi:hypothetical protein
MSIEYYKGTQAEMQALDAQITSNCGWPSGGTINWATPRETVDAGVYAIEVPQGSHGFTKAQMISGVVSTVYTNVEFPTS